MDYSILYNHLNKIEKKCLKKSIGYLTQHTVKLPLK